MHDRRSFIKGVGAAAGVAVVAGWSPQERSWVRRAHAGDFPFEKLPPLEGEVVADPGTIVHFTEDFGRLRFREPDAVLVPKSVDDIVAMVRFARRHGIGVAVNGQSGMDDQRESHSQFGQAQVEGGLAIDPKPLAAILGVDSQRRVVHVEAGARWSEVFDATEAFGFAPAVMTDFMYLSVGGTLSVGGIGGHTGRLGLQADQVVEMEVVTGEGERVVCSPTRNAELFDAVRAGCGQVAIIIRATVKLEPITSHARVFELFYDDIEVYVRDQSRLVLDKRFDHLQGSFVQRSDGSGWRFVIEAAAYFNTPDEPDADALLAGLGDDRASAQIHTTTYRDWQFRVDPFAAFLKSVSAWAAPHPWVSVWLPGSRAAHYLGTLADRLTPADLGFGVAITYPIDTSLVKPPLFRLPDERVVFHLSLLRFPPAGASGIAAMLQDNRRIYDEVVALGGTRYPPGAIPSFSPFDWQRHFQPEWGRLVRAKRRFDPDSLLSPGWGIFRFR